MRLESGGATRDVLGGALIVAIGVFVLIEGYRYDVGTLSAMGGGFFPVVLGTVVAILGGIIAITALPEASFDIAPLRWAATIKSESRGFAAIISSILAFILILKFFGLAPAAFCTVFISALGDRTSTIRGSAVLAVLMTIFAIGLFSYVLHVEIPIFKFPA